MGCSPNSRGLADGVILLKDEPMDPISMRALLCSMRGFAFIFALGSAVETLKQRGSPTWQRLAGGRSVAVKHFLLRQLHIQATPQLYPP
jgi:hypothetical protein